MVAGIYLITNKINGHMYVGGSIDIIRRLNQHKRCADINTQVIDRAILKYGKENFFYQIITELPPDWDVISKHEKYWIKFYNTYENDEHYNVTEGGNGTCGYIPSEKAREKMSKNHADVSGKNNPNYGNPNNYKHSVEIREKISKSHTGKKKTEEHKKKIGEALIRKDIPCPMDLLDEYNCSDITYIGLAEKYNCGVATIARRIKKARND